MRRERKGEEMEGGAALDLPAELDRLIDQYTAYPRISAELRAARDALVKGRAMLNQDRLDLRTIG